MLFIDHYISIEWVCPFLRRLSSLLVNFGTSTYITCKPHPGNQKQIYYLKENLILPLRKLYLHAAHLCALLMHVCSKCVTFRWMCAGRMALTKNWSSAIVSPVELYYTNFSELSNLLPVVCSSKRVKKTHFAFTLHGN